MKLILLLTSLTLTVFLSSCEHQEMPLDRKSKREVDTLYRNEVKTLSPRMDSICEVLEDSLYTIFLDSFILQRRKEREAILNKRR